MLAVNRDRRAELVMTSCEYSDPSDTRRLGEDRQIAGVYQASAGRWILLRSAVMAPYSQVARAANGGRGVKWLHVAPNEWPDQLSGCDTPASLRLEQLLSKPPDCPAIDLRFVDGHFELPPPDDPCKVLAEGGAVYSDGRTRFGHPNVMIDGPDGRDIYVANNDDALRRIMSAGYRLKLLGDDKHPSWLWIQLP